MWINHWFVPCIFSYKCIDGCSELLYLDFVVMFFFEMFGHNDSNFRDNGLILR